MIFSPFGRMPVNLLNEDSAAPLSRSMLARVEAVKETASDITAKYEKIPFRIDGAADNLQQKTGGTAYLTISHGVSNSNIPRDGKSVCVSGDVT